MAAPDTPLGRVVLVTGKEEFLGERTVAAVRGAVRRADPEAELSETQASGLTLATFGELAAPSLFSTVRCVVVRGLEDLPDDSVDGLLAYAAILCSLLLPRETRWAVVLVTALAGTIFSAYLFGVQALELHAFCAWCLASDVVITAVAALAAASFLAVERR